MKSGLSRGDYTPFIAVAAGLVLVSVTLLRGASEGSTSVQGLHT